MTEPFARYRPSEHLLSLVERSGAASARLRLLTAEQLDATRQQAREEQARLSALLDGSPGEDATGPSMAGWAATLGALDETAQELVAREYANLLTCADVEVTVANTFFEQPLDALIRLHAAICDGLVAPDHIGRFRTTERAIHDGAQGQMLWAAPRPDRLHDHMEGLLDWLGGAGATTSTLVLAAVVHERILQWQPFEAANGRLARAVARVIRRARGLDTHGLATPERYWHPHTLAYHREVAATMRRRGDLTAWIHKAVTVETLALEAVADACLPTPPAAVPPAVVALLQRLETGSMLAVKDVVAHTGLTRPAAWDALMRARNARLIEDDVTVAVPRFRLLAGHPSTGEFL